jgi:hypothetical protein
VQYAGVGGPTNFNFPLVLDDKAGYVLTVVAASGACTFSGQPPPVIAQISGHDASYTVACP